MAKISNLDKQENTNTSLVFAFETSALNPILETSAIDPDFKKLCITCVASKSTPTVKCRKSMTPINEKLAKLHVNLWELHNPPL